MPDNVEAELSTSAQVPEEQPKRKKMTWWILGAILLLLLIGGAAAYMGYQGGIQERLAYQSTQVGLVSY